MSNNTGFLPTSIQQTDSNLLPSFALVQPIFFTVCYTLSTPAGIATGIALFSSFNPNSPSNLLSVGIIEAVCGGVMIWDALVNMISTNITFGDGFYELGVWHKTGVFVALWMGAAVMAIIGYWA